MEHVVRPVGLGGLMHCDLGPSLSKERTCHPKAKRRRRRQNESRCGKDRVARQGRHAEGMGSLTCNRGSPALTADYSRTQQWVLTKLVSRSTTRVVTTTSLPTTPHTRRMCNRFPRLLRRARCNCQTSSATMYLDRSIERRRSRSIASEIPERQWQCELPLRPASLMPWLPTFSRAERRQPSSITLETSSTTSEKPSITTTSFTNHFEPTTDRYSPYLAITTML